MCTVLLPGGLNPIAVNEYININNSDAEMTKNAHSDYLYYVAFGWYFLSVDRKIIIVVPST